MFTRLDPKQDIVFKILFSAPENRDLLISLLTAVLRPSSPIVSVQVLDPHLEKELVTDKGAVLDVRVSFELCAGLSHIVEQHTDIALGSGA
jgi:predicted transposase/invertase (TIGR01784 family)